VRNQDIINLFIAIGFMSVTILWPKKQRKVEPRSTQHYRWYGARKKPGFLSSEAASEAISAKTQKRETKEEQYWAKQNKIALGALVVNCMALGFLVLTAIIASFAYFETQKQATAAIEGNKISRESFTSVQRAFITIDGLDISAIKSVEGGEITHWMFKTIIKNSGNTPTKDMRWAHGGEAAGPVGEPIRTAPGMPLPTTAHDPDMMYDNIIHMRQYAPRALLGPQTKLPIEVGGFGIPLIELRKISKGEAVYFIVASIHYHDVFKGSPEHITKSCFRIGAAIESDDTIKPSYGLCPHWNCADDECENDRREYEEEMAAKSKPSPSP
jgi:hypothetical protein